MMTSTYIVSFDRITRHQFRIDQIDSDAALHVAGERLTRLADLADQEKPIVVTFSRVTVDELPILKGNIQ